MVCVFRVRVIVGTRFHWLSVPHVYKSPPFPNRSENWSTCMRGGKPVVLVGACAMFIPRSFAVIPEATFASGNIDVKRPYEARTSNMAEGERMRVQFAPYVWLVRCDQMFPLAAGPGKVWTRYSWPCWKVTVTFRWLFWSIT